MSRSSGRAPHAEAAERLLRLSGPVDARNIKHGYAWIGSTLSLQDLLSGMGDLERAGLPCRRRSRTPSPPRGDTRGPTETCSPSRRILAGEADWIGASAPGQVLPAEQGPGGRLKHRSGKGAGPPKGPRGAPRARRPAVAGRCRRAARPLGRGAPMSRALPPGPGPRRGQPAGARRPPRRAAGLGLGPAHLRPRQPRGRAAAGRAGRGAAGSWRRRIWPRPCCASASTRRRRPGWRPPPGRARRPGGAAGRPQPAARAQRHVDAGGRSHRARAGSAQWEHVISSRDAVKATEAQLFDALDRALAR